MLVRIPSVMCFFCLISYISFWEHKIVLIRMFLWLFLLVLTIGHPKLPLIKEVSEVSKAGNN